MLKQIGIRNILNVALIFFLFSGSMISEYVKLLFFFSVQAPQWFHIFISL